MFKPKHNTCRRFKFPESKTHICAQCTDMAKGSGLAFCADLQTYLVRWLAVWFVGSNLTLIEGVDTNLHVGRMGEEREVYRVLVGNSEWRRLLGRPRPRWVDNIRMDLQEVGCGFMKWIRLTQDRDRWRKLLSAVMNLRVPWNAVNFLTSCKLVSFSRRTLHHGVSK